MRDIFSILTERRIQEAIARGDFKNLSGAGKPLKIERLQFLPQSLRAAYIILKNSGYFNQPHNEQKLMVPEAQTESDLPINQAISQEELTEEIFRHKVMMDCRRGR